MSLLVTGSIGIDTIETPFGNPDDVVGGSAVYFSYAASFFAPVRLVGVIGPDYPHDLRKLFASRDVDLTGLETRQGSKSFRWHGSYVQNMNEAQTVAVDLNVLAEAAPKIPAPFLDTTHVFLANTHPALQSQMIDALKSPRLIVADTMNLWIETTRNELLGLLKKIDGLVLNDGEARLLTGEKNMILASRKVLDLGPKFVVIKKGEHGSLMASREDNEVFVLPAFPADRVVDPTGAGDSFAAGMMGYLATQSHVSAGLVRRAMAYGTVVGSHPTGCVTPGGRPNAPGGAIEQRLAELGRVIRF